MLDDMSFPCDVRKGDGKSNISWSMEYSGARVGREPVKKMVEFYKFHMLPTDAAAGPV